MLFNYSGILNSGFLEKLKLANYLAYGGSRFAADATPGVPKTDNPQIDNLLKKVEPIKKDIGDILNLEEIAKIREQNPKDRLRVPKEYERGVERARGKYRDEIVNKNIQKMKDENRETSDPVYAPAKDLDTYDLPDSISNKAIKDRTQALYHKVNRYLAEVDIELAKPENRNNQELKNVRTYLASALHEITRFMKSKFYTHRLTKSKDPLRMHRSPSKEDIATLKRNREDIPDSEKQKKKEDKELERDPYTYDEDRIISMDPKELEEQTQKYVEMLDVLEVSSNKFKESYQQMIAQLREKKYILGYIEKTFPAAFHTSPESQKEFLSKPFGTIWYLTPVSANADLYGSEYEEVPGKPIAAQSSTVLYQPKFLRTAKDLLPENFKDKQKAYQAQIGKGMGEEKLTELTDLLNGDTQAWENAKYILKGWKPSHIAKLIKSLDWSSIADKETIDDIVSPTLDKPKRKRDMYYDQDVGSDFFDPSQLDISEEDRKYLEEKGYIDEDYKKVMQENEKFRSGPDSEKKHSYIFSAKIPASSLDIEKMRDQYEKKNSGIFNAIYVTAGKPVYLTGIMAINLTDEETEIEEKFNDLKVTANQMPLVGMRVAIDLMNKRYAMPKSIGWTKEDHLEIFESSAGDMYRLENGKYYLLDDRFMPVKGIEPLTHEQMLAIDPENNPKGTPVVNDTKTAESLGPNPVQAVPANTASPESKVVKPVPEKPGVFVNKNKEVYIEQNGALHPVDENGKPGPVDNEVEKTSALIDSALSRLAAQPIGIMMVGDAQDVIPASTDCQSDLVPVEEMYSFIFNDRDLARKYLESNIRVVRDEIQFGTYTPDMAVELWKDTVNAGALAWGRKNNCDAEVVFPDNLREELARKMSQDFYAAIMNGQYNDFLNT